MILEVQEVLESLYEDVIIPNWDSIKKIYVGDYNHQTGKYLPINIETENRLKRNYEDMESYEWEINTVETSPNSITLGIRDSELCISMSVEYNENQEVIGFSCMGE